MADKKLLEESTIRRFMQLANIKPGEQGVLTEGMKAGGAKDSDKSRFAGDSDAKGERRNPHGLREEEDQEKVEEAYHEEGMEEEGYMKEEADEMGGLELDAGGDAGMEGGDIESAVQGLVDSLNSLLSAAGMGDKTVELEDEGGEEGGEEMEEPEGDEAGGEEDMGDEEALAESVELVDDDVVERLLQRVSARLVRESRKPSKEELVEKLLQRVSARLMAEAKSGSGWGKKGMHSDSSVKKKTKGHGPKSKSGTPFTKKMSTKGLANR